MFKDKYNLVYCTDEAAPKVKGWKGGCILSSLPVHRIIPTKYSIFSVQIQKSSPKPFPNKYHSSNCQLYAFFVLTYVIRKDIWASGVILEVEFQGKLEKIGVWNSHLTAFPYGPYEVITSSPETVEKETKEVQGDDIEQIWKQLIEPEETPEGVPKILLGDHNIPSHIDGAVTGESSK